MKGSRLASCRGCWSGDRADEVRARASHPIGGFTLIELLVVMAIIAILAAILFPVYAAAKERAKVGACVAHQKQLGVAFQHYLSDWNDRVCPTYMLPYPNGHYWSQLLWPYTTRNVNLFYCPGLPNWRGFDTKTMSYSACWGITIGMNAVFGDPGWGGAGPTRPVTLAEVGSPSKTILFACSSYKNYANWGDPPSIEPLKSGHYVIAPGNKSEPLLCLAPRVNPRNWPYDFFDLDRHNGATVVTHLDGHVTVYRTTRLLTPQGTDWHDPDFSMWDLF
jgi:prepilin-type N-terminal cleavage/methylation domain-containing protein/prepilin-type processing-associated H-X9-DG protein